jgi:hypothetical protein
MVSLEKTKRYLEVEGIDRLRGFEEIGVGECPC